MRRVTDHVRQKRWARYDNAELARRKWALNPDAPHPYTARKLTAKHDPSMAWMLRGSYRKNDDLRAKPCRRCGGSRGLPIHEDA